MAKKIATSRQKDNTAANFQKNWKELEERTGQFRKEFREFMDALAASHKLARNIASEQRLHATPSLVQSMKYDSAPQSKRKSSQVELTVREKEVVRLITLGCTTAEMGRILGISESTADNTRTRAMKRLGVTKAALLTRVALQHGITTAADKLTPTEKRKGRITSDGWN
jgi:DNA-binding CsgD family transcriptional regulator